MTEKGRRELDVMAKLLEQDTGDSTVQPWDWRYYDTQIRRRDFGVDPNEVAAYFPLEQVLDGMLELTGEVFGVEYRLLEDQPVWDPDVTARAIVDRATGEEIAIRLHGPVSLARAPTATPPPSLWWGEGWNQTAATGGRCRPSSPI